MDKILTKIFNKHGFSLLEVLMAITLFSFFILAFVMSQGSGKSASILLKEDVTLHNLAELKMNEILINPPQFTNATENDVETKNFELEDYKHYKYKIEYKKLTVPDLTQLQNESENQDENSTSNQSIQKMVFEKLKKNIEQILWQVRVTVTNTETDYSYELSTWLINEEANVDLNLNF